MALPLPREEVHLWYLLSEEARAEAQLDRYRALITSEESERTERYLFPRSKVEHLQTRALARTVLARYLDVDPRELRFSLTERGRPELSRPADPTLRFNLSNTEGLIVCAVSRDRELGVDVEHIHRSGQTVEIAERFFSPVELAELRRLPADRQRERFFDYWTLKEAYLKARGVGLGLPLDKFSFRIDDDGLGPIRIEIDPLLADRAERWWFQQLALTPVHKTALAVEKMPDESLQVLLRKTVP